MLSVKYKLSLSPERVFQISSQQNTASNLAAFQFTVRNYNLLKQKNVISTYICPILLGQSNTGRNVGPLIYNGQTELDKVCFV